MDWKFGQAYISREEIPCSILVTRPTRQHNMLHVSDILEETAPVEFVLYSRSVDVRSCNFKRRSVDAVAIREVRTAVI